MATSQCRPCWLDRSAAGNLEHRDSARSQPPPRAGSKTPPRSSDARCLIPGRPWRSPPAGGPCSCRRSCSGRGWRRRWRRECSAGSKPRPSVARLSSRPPWLERDVKRRWIWHQNIFTWRALKLPLACCQLCCPECCCCCWE